VILNFNNYKNSVLVQFLFRIESRIKMVVIRIRINNIFIRLSFTYFYEIKTLKLSRLLFLGFKICNGAKQNYCENICTLTLSKDFFVYLFFIKNLVKVHCIHCHPRIKCSSNIYDFPPSLPKKV